MYKISVFNNPGNICYEWRFNLVHEMIQLWASKGRHPYEYRYCNCPDGRRRKFQEYIGYWVIDLTSIKPVCQSMNNCTRNIPGCCYFLSFFLRSNKRPKDQSKPWFCRSVRPWWKSICKIKPVYKEGCEDSHYAKTIPISETIIKILRLVKIRLRATSMDGLKKRLFPWTKARPLPRGDQTAV